MTTLSGGFAWSETGVQTLRPLYSFNQSPLIQIYGLPALGESRVLGTDESALALHLQLANHFTGASSSAEALSLDGETRRLTLHWRQGLPGNKEWGVELGIWFISNIHPVSEHIEGCPNADKAAKQCINFPCLMD